MNKYLEKIAFSRLSETSFKNLSDDEKSKVHHYITHEADAGRPSIVGSRATMGGALGGIAGLMTRGKFKAGLVGAAVGGTFGAKLGTMTADKVKNQNIDRTLNHANLASVLRQPMNDFKPPK